MPAPLIPALAKVASIGSKAAKAYSVASTIYGGIKGAGEKLSQGDISGAIGSAVGAGSSAFDKSQQLYQSEKDKSLIKQILENKSDDQTARETKQLAQSIDNSKLQANKNNKTSLLEEAEYENRLLLKLSDSLEVIKAYNEKKTIEDRKRSSDALKGIKGADENEKLLRSAIMDVKAADSRGAPTGPGGGGNDFGNQMLDSAINLLAFMPGSNIARVMANLRGLKGSALGLRDTLRKGKNQFRWQKGQNIPKGFKPGQLRAQTAVEKQLVKMGNTRLGRGLVRTADNLATRVGNFKAPSIRTVGNAMNVAALAAETGYAVYDAYKASTDEERINQMRNIENLTGQSLESQVNTATMSTIGGALAGMALGAAAGSVIPIIGTLLGGAVGFFAGKKGIEFVMDWATSKVDGDGVPDDPNFLKTYNGNMIEALKTGETNANIFKMNRDYYLIGKWDNPVEDYNDSLESWNKLQSSKIGVNGYKGSTLEHLKLMSLFSKNGNYNGWNIGDVLRYVGSPLPEDKKKIMIRRFLKEGLFEYFDEKLDDEGVNQLIFQRTGKTAKNYLNSMKSYEDKLVDDFFNRFGKNTPTKPKMMTVEDYNKMLEEYDRMQNFQLIYGLNNRQMATGGVLKSQLNLGTYSNDSIQSLNDAQSDIAKSFEGAIKSVGSAMSSSEFDDGLQNYLMTRMLPELGNTLFDLIQNDKNNRKTIAPGLSTVIPIWG